MAAIITDQIRILNAKNFVSGVTSSANAYYSFIGLPNPNDYQSDWDTTPPSPKDNFSEENDYWDTMVALKKINSSDVRQVIPKRTWSSGTTYDMYRHDVSRSKTAAVSGATNLYASFYYVMNTDYQVYICLQNGSDPDNANGKPSLDEPTFTDLEPRSAGSSNDGYVWKYLYTITPSDVIKFETTDFMPVPADWATATNTAAVRDNAVDGSIKIVTVTDRGVGLGTANITYTNVPVLGDGQGAKATVVINNDSKVESVTIAQGGGGYTYANVRIVQGNVYEQPALSTTATIPATVTGKIEAIISPEGGHGADLAAEFFAKRVMTNVRLTYAEGSGDFPVDNDFRRIGIIQDPFNYGTTTVATASTLRGIAALKLSGTGDYTVDEEISQTVVVGSGTGTAKGKVVSWDSTNRILKYFQSPDLHTDAGVVRAFDHATNNVTGATSSTAAAIDGNADATVADVAFTDGKANPEIAPNSGDIVYIENRRQITRAADQIEDIKLVIEF